jgi:putative tricarboxylic transport membrane protein
LAGRILAACALVLAAGYLYATSQLPSFEFGDPLGPRTFPALLGILLAVAGVLLLLEARVRRRAPAESPPPGVSHPRAVAGVAAATLAFIALLEPLGYLVAVTAYLFGVMRWLHGRRPGLCLAIAVLFALGSYMLFVKALGVALAKGILHF